MDKKKLGELIKSKRIEKGLTQKQLANQINYSDSVIKSIEQAKSSYTPSSDVIKALVDTLEIDVEDDEVIRVRQAQQRGSGALKQDSTETDTQQSGLPAGKFKFLSNKTLSFLLFFLASGLIIASVYWFYYAPFYQVKKNMSQYLDDYMKKKESPLADYGAIINLASQKRNLDPRILIALAGVETNFGKNDNIPCVKEHNFWNLRENGVCKKYSTISDAINDFFLIVQLSNQKYHFTDFKTLSENFCYRNNLNCEGYVNMSDAIYSELGGDLSNLAYRLPLGDLDLWGYCQDKYKTSQVDVTVEARRITDAFSWRCMVKDENSNRKRQMQINFDEACAAEYGNYFEGSGQILAPRIKAQTENIYRTDLWRCYYDN